MLLEPRFSSGQILLCIHVLVSTSYSILSRTPHSPKAQTLNVVHSSSHFFYVLFLCVNFLHEVSSPPSPNLPLQTVVAAIIKSSVVHRLSSRVVRSLWKYLLLFAIENQVAYFLDFWLFYLPVDSSCISNNATYSADFTDRMKLNIAASPGVRVQLKSSVNRMTPIILLKEMFLSF
ncbi:hypothetical protein L1987_83854 [Smallanthus sonchifolius]|uniref:Uncharacterized protein n=1 Tax=Smallanthus sonchifolius TaxID=185202 RepID=A0ACB8YDS3_9ASTR|nr:hypothetical protein L1987_83854 [Smallanthus sonchifolius]